MDGIPALDLWDLVIEVFHSSANQTNKTKDVREPRGKLSANTQPNMQKHFPTSHTNLDLIKINHVPSNGTLCICTRTDLLLCLVSLKKQQQFEGYAVDPETRWRFYNESRGNLSTASLSSSGIKPTGRRAIGILSILQGLTIGEHFFSELGPVSVAWRKTLQTTDGECEQYTHKYSTYRVAQHDHISSREHT